MTRIALYARYSSDMQSASSIEDQFRICREFQCPFRARSTILLPLQHDYDY